MLDTPITTTEPRAATATCNWLDRLCDVRLRPDEPEPRIYSMRVHESALDSPVTSSETRESAAKWRSLSNRGRSADPDRETHLALSTPQTLTEAAEAIRGLFPTSRGLW